MPGLSFLSKKSWHTSNLCNQEKVWIAEQKAESEARKCAELREQIKVEREREEFDRLTRGGDAVGDRGTNWMYEGGGAVAAAPGIGGGGGASAAREEEEEARRNEAYLLGEEYAPGGGARQSGDFAEASTMTGALEKASTYGATIGAGYAADNGGGSTRLRIQEDTATTSSAAADAAAAADGGDGAKTNNDEKDGDWSQNFHLRHEDPMFAVHQRRQAQLKDAEKKKRLLERAGLDVSVVARRDPVGGNGEDGEYRKGDASKGDGDDDDAGRRERKRRSKSEKKKKRRSVREEEHRRHRHSKSKRDKHKRRKNNRDDDDRSSSSSPSYSSSSASVSSGRHRRHRDGRKGQRVYSTEYDRSRRRAEEDDYDDRSRNRDGSGRRGERRRSRSVSRRRMSGGEDNDHHRDRRTVRDYDEKIGRRRLDGHGDSRNRDDEGGGDREQASSSAPSPSGTFNNDDNTGMAIAGGGRYGLVGTSVSNNDIGDGASTRHQQRRDRRDNNYLGPDRSLIESKRRAEAEERERVLKLSRKGDRR